jgi:hypothetical protein
LCDQLTGRRVWSIGRRWVPSTSPSSYTHSPSRWDTLGRYICGYIHVWIDGISLIVLSQH